MKLNCLFAFLFLNYFCYAQKSEEQVIADILNAESRDFNVLTFEEIALKYWKLDENTGMTITLQNGKTIYRNKEKLLATKRKAIMEENITENTDVFVHINGDMAFSSHEETITNKSTGAKAYSHQLHVFVRVDGVWKINISNIHQYSKG